MFYNLDGKSFSHSLQVELHVRITEQLELRTAYKFYDIQTDYKSGRKTKPLVPTNRAFMNIAYATNFDKWKFDLTGQWFGTSRLPSTETNPADYQIPSRSLSYFMFNGQVTRAFKHFEVYVGVENLTNFTQDNPIIAANDPFGSNFDASLIWGSINGRITYAGIRYKFNKL